MQDQPATSAQSSTTPPQDSYVDTYTPPQASGAPTPDTVAPAQESTESVSAAAPTSATPAPSTSDAQGDANRPTGSQNLEDQNIFFLLGVEDGSDEEKEAFLDELQQVIWEDFLDRDVELLLTEEEFQGLKQLMVQKDKSELQIQEDMVVYLEKLIPDLEEILLEKALELKEDMVKERLASMRELAAGKDEVLAKLSEAETLIRDNQWRSAAEVLNALPA